MGMQLGYSKMYGDMLTRKLELQEEALKLHGLVVEATEFVPIESVAKAIATKMSNVFMDHVARSWWELAFKLIAKYSNGLITYGRGPQAVGKRRPTCSAGPNQSPHPLLS